MSKKKVQKQQSTESQQQATVTHVGHQPEGSSTNLVVTGIVLLAIFCVLLIAALLTQQPTPVVIPAGPQQAAPADGPDSFGRMPGDEHHGHAHP